MREHPTWRGLLGALADGNDLTIAEATWAMENIISGSVTPAQLGAFLLGLRTKGETVDEILGFRDAALSLALPFAVDPMLLDIVGTGGDQLGTVNVSTMASVVAAASGVPVAKFGNRAVSSRSGSADVLAALGVNLDLPPERVVALLGEVGITFAFAPVFLPGFRNAAQVRSELAIPTVFNILGPLCNPAGPNASAVGVAHKDRVPLVVGVFQSRDTTAIVFRGDDGLDELTTTGHSHLWEISHGMVTEHDLNPRDLGIPHATVDDLRGGDAQHNAQVFQSVLAGERSPIRDIVLLNAAAGLVAFRLAHDPSLAQKSIVERLAEQYEIAAHTIDSGAAARLLDAWVRATTLP